MLGLPLQVIRTMKTKKFYGKLNVNLKKSFSKALLFVLKKLMKLSEVFVKKQFSVPLEALFGQCHFLLWRCEPPCLPGYLPLLCRIRTAACSCVRAQQIGCSSEQERVVAYYFGEMVPGSDTQRYLP